MTKLLALVTIGGLGFLLRDKLVHLLTVATGTWVGTPDV